MGGRIENPYEVLEGILAGVVEPRDLPLALLEDITEHFSDERKIGEGGFGAVYKGLLHNGETVAVKKILKAIPSSQTQFENEVNLLMKLKHQNIVRLVGYCYETRHLHMPYEGKSVFAWDTESLLCLECMPNGSLDKYISDASSGLNWHTRCKIIKGISYGLQYLHEHSNGPIIHLDLKPANILLDAKMLPKITDFGLTRLFDQNQTIHTANTSGTLGYMSPELLRGIITPMSDIFSLGVIIMEVITGHRDYPDDIRKNSEGFIVLELQKWRNRLQKEPCYSSLETDCQQIERCIQIGLICVNPERTKRPTMKKIVDMLEGFESMNWYISNEQHQQQHQHISKNLQKSITTATTAAAATSAAVASSPESERANPGKLAPYYPGTCARRLNQYMYHQQHRPQGNNIEYWRKFVKEYFAPTAKKRWCVSLYGSDRQTTGVFPQGMQLQDVWHCEICNQKPGRGFETTFEVLPRLYQIKYESGLEELLYIDMPRESTNASGQITLDYMKAIQESVFEQLRVVREGHLRVVFNPDLKIVSWEFCARHHEELIPRR
ncbi:hypothetical protein QYE76_059807 [Lolium multiflorum]|uniref:Protein kinase domain-containing protein n=1 Tax=Lolium multiflorum TaxID=4521 RepID=A0AAD8W5U9_LOLMU|nr:hypothetical protein QYE76_059807 [Lolium multiflorum]